LHTQLSGQEPANFVHLPRGQDDEAIHRPVGVQRRATEAGRPGVEVAQGRGTGVEAGQEHDLGL